MGERVYKKSTCQYIQQDYKNSNTWQCSECKEEIWWGEYGADIDIKYCPYCGKRIESFFRIEDDKEN